MSTGHVRVGKNAYAGWEWMVVGYGKVQLSRMRLDLIYTRALVDTVAELAAVGTGRNIAPPTYRLRLEFFQGAVPLLAQRNLIELLQDGVLEAFAEAAGLRQARLRPGVVDIRKC